jgi:hypothetical protein
MSHEEFTKYVGSLINMYLLKYLYLEIFFGVVSLLLIFKGWILRLPFKLIKLIAGYLCEWFGTVCDYSKKEIRQKKHKILKDIDKISAAKDLADTYKSFKK